MARDAFCTSRLWLMLMMRFGIEGAGHMTLGAERITLCNQFIRVHVMAVITSYPFLVHLALHKRAQHEDFVVDLTIAKVKPLVK